MNPSRPARLRAKPGLHHFLVAFLLSFPATGSDYSTVHAIERCLPVLPLGLNSLVPVPIDNPLTHEKVELGRRLFFDPGLSRDGMISCASCHQPEKAFTDGRALAVGIEQRVGRRNVPTLLNGAYGKAMFWDGRAASLEEQALVPLTHPHEMDNSLESIVEHLRADGVYQSLFDSAFGSAEATPRRIAQALASYQRSLVAGDSPFDRYLILNDESALSDAARRGLALFHGKARCSHCHEGPLFTDQKFHNTGVGWGIEPLDLGRFEHTGDEADKGRFKTPTLRNVTLTAPYMHDGSIASLEEVIEFYDRGGQPNPSLDPTIRPLNLSAQEKSDLIAFLRSLIARADAGAEPRPIGIVELR